MYDRGGVALSGSTHYVCDRGGVALSGSTHYVCDRGGVASSGELGNTTAELRILNQLGYNSGIVQKRIQLCSALPCEIVDLQDEGKGL